VRREVDFEPVLFEQTQPVCVTASLTRPITKQS